MDTVPGDVARVRLSLVLPGGPRRFGQGRPSGSALSCWVHEVLGEVPDTPLRDGDMLFYIPMSGNRTELTREQRACIRGDLERVYRVYYPKILEHRRRVRLLAGTSFPYADWSDALFDYLDKWADRSDLAVDTGPLWVVRPWHTLSEPVRAVDDVAAVERLIESLASR